MEDGGISQVEQMLEDSKSESEMKWLTFWMDKQLFGLSISYVERIVSMLPITEMPEYPAYAKGIINLRGNIIPLVDLRLRLGRAGVEYDGHTCIIVINVDNSQLGFIVDEVDAVLDIPKERITPPPQMGQDAANRYLIGVARIFQEAGVSEKMVLCLDATKVLRQEEYDCLQSKHN